MSVCFYSFQLINVVTLRFLSVKRLGIYVDFQTNPETETKTVSRGPANLKDEYFRLLGIRSRRNLKRFEGPLGRTWRVVVSWSSLLVFKLKLLYYIQEDYYRTWPAFACSY